MNLGKLFNQDNFYIFYLLHYKSLMDLYLTLTIQRYIKKDILIHSFIFFPLTNLHALAVKRR